MAKLFSISLLLLLFVASVSAKWASIPLEGLVADSDVVLVGTLHSAEENEDGLGSGYITVDRVISSSSLTGIKTKDGKALTTGHEVKITWADNWACASGMHKGWEGKTGIWLLKISEDGTVVADYPGRFQPVDDLEKVRKMLVRVKTGAPASVDVSGSRPNENVLSCERRPPSNGTWFTAMAFLRASIVLLLSAGLYWFFYKRRFRLR